MEKITHINNTYYGETHTIILEDGYAFVMVTVMAEHPDVAVIHDLYVHRDRRGLGLGSKTLEEACKEGSVLRVQSLILSVTPGSWLEGWYKRHGFKDTGKTEKILGVELKVMTRPCSEI